MPPRRRAGLSSAGFLIAAATACGSAPAPPPLEPLHVVTPSGVSFNEACTPTGPEVCFNAIDDNCNGAIDEGCGIAVGKIQLELAWEGPASVGMTVVDPLGNRLDGAHRSVPSGFKMDRLCPKDGCHGQNVVNVAFAGERPPSGQYSVQIELESVNGAALPVEVTFGWVVGVRGASTKLSLKGLEDKKLFSFEI